MSLIGILLTLLVVGFIMYLVNAYVPMPAPFKAVINGIVVIILIIWLLQVFGLIGAMPFRIR